MVANEVREESVSFCDLCGLPLDSFELSLQTLSGSKHFCCEGCAGVYKMLHGADIVSGESSSLGGTKD